MKLFTRISMVVLVTILACSPIERTMAASAVPLGTAANFAILAGSTVTNTGSSVVTGDVGVSTGSAIVGFPPGTISGTQHSNDAAAISAQAALTTAYNNAAGQTPVTTVATELGGTTKTAGVYDSAGGTFVITGTLTLDAQNDPNAVFIFKTGTTLNPANSSIVHLINGAQACNVFWQVGSSATLGTSAVFKGNILAQTAITLTTGASVEGSLLARDAAVTLDTNVVSRSVCAPASALTSSGGNRPGKINVIKLVINDNGGTKTVSDFPLYVNGVSVVSGVTNSFNAPGPVFTITEKNDPNYIRSFSGDCSLNGQLNLNPGDYRACIVTNDDIGAPVVVPPVPPLIDVVNVPAPLALPAGPGQVIYTYTLRNIGTVPVTNVTMVGDTCGPITYVSGDINSDSKLGLNEIWMYRCSKTLSNTDTNTVVATGWANGISATDLATAAVNVGTPVVPPLIHVTKVPSTLTLGIGGGTVTYSERLTNVGVTALSNVTLSDDRCAPVKYISGDTNGDSKLDTTEAWNYTCQASLSKTTTNTAIASGSANGLTARDFAVATVVVATNVPQLPNTGTPPDDGSALWATVIAAGILVALIALIVKKQTA